MTATRLVERIGIDCAPLLNFPQAGAARDQFAAGLRVTFEATYAVYYTHDEDELVVVRVLHGARDAAALAERGAFASR